ncbi:hypothetical protein RHMOL_Rhmol05G0174000 [Rhododendron molle]|nr:hypothetical protein RHMOL_Rhmol05G0174000 [Rhododendron molle]
MDSIPDCLERFLSDPEICFVGVNMIHWHFQLCYDYSIECKSCIEVIELVARYFQKPKSIHIVISKWAWINKFNNNAQKTPHIVISKVSSLLTSNQIPPIP